MERLEYVKEDYELKNRLGGLWVYIPKANFDWLIEQAEGLLGTEHRHGYKGMYGLCNSDYAELNSVVEMLRRENGHLKQTVEEQQKEIEWLKQGHLGLLEENGRLNRSVEELVMAYEGEKKENARFHKALKFYADLSIYNPHEGNCDGLPTIENDIGNIARQALKE